MLRTQLNYEVQSVEVLNTASTLDVESKEDDILKNNIPDVFSINNECPKYMPPPQMPYYPFVLIANSQPKFFLSITMRHKSFPLTRNLRHELKLILIPDSRTTVVVSLKKISITASKPNNDFKD